MKTYEQLIDLLAEYNSHIIGQPLPPHSTNLMHQLNKNEPKNLPLFNDVCNRYFRFRKEASIRNNVDLSEYISSVVDETNSYMDLFATKNPFSHQQDFTSSIIPEMFYFIFSRIIKESEFHLFVQAQDDLPIECMFDLHGGGRILFKYKRLDLSLCRKSVLTLNGIQHTFVIPMLAMEIKTNLDKNMLAGIENSASALKKTFPKCLYLVVSEFADLAADKLNYASTDIDEIYIIRNQRRASVRGNKNPKNNINTELVKDIAYVTVDLLNSFSKEQMTLEERMKTGKLI